MSAPAAQAESASIVHEKFPHNGIVLQGDGNYGGWYQHEMTGGRIAMVNWSYCGTDPMYRTITVFEWDRDDSPIFTRHRIRLGSPCSHTTVALLNLLEAS